MFVYYLYGVLELRAALDGKFLHGCYILSEIWFYRDFKSFGTYLGNRNADEKFGNKTFEKLY